MKKETREKKERKKLKRDRRILGRKKENIYLTPHEPKM